MNENPADKARRLGVPLIPSSPNLPELPENNPIDPTVAVCGKCGLEIKRIMGYFCSQGNCPSGLGSRFSLDIGTTGVMM
jgi:hypothetical protein